jgi:hypothetical protein
MTTVRYQVRFGREIKPRRKAKRVTKPVPAEKQDRPTQTTVDSRASARQLLALAYYVERGLIDGSISSFDEAAAIAGISRVRLSQVMKLLDLKPDLQETILCRDIPVAERRLRSYARFTTWGCQATTS